MEMPPSSPQPNTEDTDSSHMDNTPEPLTPQKDASNNDLSVISEPTLTPQKDLPASPRKRPLSVRRAGSATLGALSHNNSMQALGTSRPIVFRFFVTVHKFTLDNDYKPHNASESPLEQLSVMWQRGKKLSGETKLAQRNKANEFVFVEPTDLDEYLATRTEQLSSQNVASTTAETASNATPPTPRASMSQNASDSQLNTLASNATPQQLSTKQPFEMQVTLFLLNGRYKKKTCQFFLRRKDNSQLAKFTIDLGEIATDFVNSRREFDIERKISFVKLGTLRISIDFRIQDTKPKQVLRKLSSPAVAISRYQRTIASAATEIERLKEELESAKIESHERATDLSRQVARLKKNNEGLQRLRDESTARMMSILSTRDIISALLLEVHPDKEELAHQVQTYYDLVWTESNERITFLVDQENDLRLEESFLEKKMKFFERKQEFNIDYPNLIRTAKAQHTKVQKKLKENLKQLTAILTAFAQQEDELLNSKREELNASKTKLAELVTSTQTLREEIGSIEANKKASKKDKRRLKDLKKQEIDILTQQKQHTENINILQAEIDVVTQQHDAKKAEFEQKQKDLQQKEKQLLNDIAHYEQKQREKDEFLAEMKLISLSEHDNTDSAHEFTDCDTIRPFTESRIAEKLQELLEQKRLLQDERDGFTGDTANAIQTLQKRIQELESERVQLLQTIEGNEKLIAEHQKQLEANESSLNELTKSKESQLADNAVSTELVQLIQTQVLSPNDVQRIQSLLAQGNSSAPQIVSQQQNTPQGQLNINSLEQNTGLNMDPHELEDLCLEYRNEARLLDQNLRSLAESDRCIEVQSRLASVLSSVEQKLRTVTAPSADDTGKMLTFAQLQHEFTSLASEISSLKHAEKLSSLQATLQNKQEKITQLQAVFKEKYQSLLDSQKEVEELHQKKVQQNNEQLAQIDMREAELRLEREDLTRQQKALTAQNDALLRKEEEISALESELHERMRESDQKANLLEERMKRLIEQFSANLKVHEERVRLILDRLQSEAHKVKLQEATPLEDALTTQWPNFLHAVDSCTRDLLDEVANMSDIDLATNTTITHSSVTENDNLLQEQREINSKKDSQIDNLKEQLRIAQDQLILATSSNDVTNDLATQLRTAQEKCAILEEQLRNDRVCHETQIKDLELRINAKDDIIMQLKKSLAELTATLENSNERVQVAETYMQDLLNNLSQTEERLRVQQEAVVSLSDELRNSTDNVAALKSEIASQTVCIQQLRVADEERTQLDKRVQELRDELEASHTRLDASQRAHQDELDAASETMKRFQEKLALFDAQQAQLNSAIEAAALSEQNVLKLQSERSELEERLHQAEVLMNDFMQKSVTLERDNSDLREQVRMAHEMEQSTSAAHEEHFERIAEAEKMMNHLLFELNRERTDMDYTLKHKDDVIARLERELDDLMRGTMELQSTVTDYRVQLKEKSHELAVVRAEADSHKRTSEQLKASIEQLEMQIANKNGQIDVLNTARENIMNENVDSKVERLNTQIAELTEQLETQQNALNKSQSIVQQLENERTFSRESQELLAHEKSEEIQQLRRQLDLISQEFINSQNKAIEELREELSVARKSLEEEEKTRQTLQEESTNLQIQVNSLSEKNARLTKQVDQKKQIETLLEQVKTELQSVQDQHNSEKGVLLSRIEVLEEELKCSHLELSEQHSGSVERFTQDADSIGLAQKSAELESALHDAQSRIAEITNNRNAVQERSAVQIKSLEEKLSAKSEELKALHEAHSALKQDHASYARELAAALTSREEKEKIISQERSKVDTKSESLYAQIATLQENLEQRDRKIEQQEQRIKSLKSKNTDSKRLMSYISTLETVIKNQKTQLEKRNQLTSKLQSQCEQLLLEGNEERKYFAEQIDYLKKDLQRVAREASDQIQTLNDDLEAERKRSSSLRGELSMKIQQLMESLKQITAQRDKLQDQLAASGRTGAGMNKFSGDSIHKQLEDLKAKRREHEQRVLDTQFYLSSIKKKLQSRVDKLNQKEEHLRQMRLMLKERFAALREDKSRLHERKTELQILSGRIQGSLPKELREEIQLLSAELGEVMSSKESPALSPSTPQKRNTLPDLRLREIEEWKMYPRESPQAKRRPNSTLQ